MILYLQLPAPLPICRECLGTTSQNNNTTTTTTTTNNKKSTIEKISRCSVCGAALHYSCAPPELTIVVERGTTWSCDSCSPTCAACKVEHETQNYLVKCSGCPKCYHPACLDPALDKKNKLPWRCRHCLLSHDNNNDNKRGNKQNNDINNHSDVTTPISARKRISKIRENRK